MITRRHFAKCASIAFVGYGLAGGLRAARGADDFASRLASELARIEQEIDGRLGVAVLDTATNASGAHRGDERFPLCSTFKLLAGAAILARVDAGQETLERRVQVKASDILPYSPATEKRIGGAGMTIAELCEAAITLSDNAAGNLLLEALGGPAGLTAYMRALGDPVTRLDRNEPALNDSMPGDERDTTTPAAMLADLQALMLGDALTQGSREQLTRWMLDNKTGDERLRAGLPKGWRVGDKTGTGKRGSTNDIAIAWPPQRAPVIVTAYLTETDAAIERRNAALAAVGRTVAAALDRA